MNIIEIILPFLFSKREHDEKSEFSLLRAALFLAMVFLVLLGAAIGSIF